MPLSRIALTLLRMNDCKASKNMDCSQVFGRKRHMFENNKFDPNYETFDKPPAWNCPVHNYTCCLLPFLTINVNFIVFPSSSWGSPTLSSPSSASSSSSWEEVAVGWEDGDMRESSAWGGGGFCRRRCWVLRWCGTGMSSWGALTTSWLRAFRHTIYSYVWLRQN